MQRLPNDRRPDATQEIAPHATGGVLIFVTFKLPGEGVHGIGQIDVGRKFPNRRFPRHAPHPEPDAIRGGNGCGGDNGKIPVPARDLAKRDGADARHPVLGGTIASQWSVFRRWTKITRLTVRDAPAGAQGEGRCKSKSKGKGKGKG